MLMSCHAMCAAILLRRTVVVVEGSTAWRLLIVGPKVFFIEGGASHEARFSRVKSGMKESDWHMLTRDENYTIRTPS